VWVKKQNQLYVHPIFALSAGGGTWGGTEVADKLGRRLSCKIEPHGNRPGIIAFALDENDSYVRITEEFLSNITTGWSRDWQKTSSNVVFKIVVFVVSRKNSVILRNLSKTSMSIAFLDMIKQKRPIFA
jgi:hypothetical protein